MAFVNEYISDEDIKKYGIEELWLRYNPVYKGQKRPSGFRFQWTVDREQNIYFMMVGGGGYERVNERICLLSYKGKAYEVWIARPGEGSKNLSDEPFYIVWELSGGASYGTEVLDALKEALTVFGYDGARRQVPNTIVKFKF